jgi:hypothetical protein
MPRDLITGVATAYPSLPDSKWIDIAETVAEGHWIPAEGRCPMTARLAYGSRSGSPCMVMVSALVPNGTCSPGWSSPVRDLEVRVQHSQIVHWDVEA